MALPTEIHLTLPDWVPAFVANTPCEPTDQGRMAYVLELGKHQVARGTGGPFSAAVFDLDSNEVVAVGVNRVVPTHASIAHAEIMALTLAQQALGVHRLPDNCGLYSSTEPCAQCLGAVPWSGVGRLVCSACAADAEAIGFDEGAKPEDWPAQLEARGIRVVRHLLAERGAALLTSYGGARY